MGKEIEIVSDGATITIAPITLSFADQLLMRLEIGEMLATFGTETLAVMPTRTDELIGALCIHTNNDHATTLGIMNTLISKLFPLGESTGVWFGTNRGTEQ